MSPQFNTTTNKKYFPILFSKSGELAALKYLAFDAREGISPILIVLEGDLINVEAVLKVEWNFNNNQILLDFYHFKDIRISKLRIFFERLFDAGVKAVPVVHFNSPEVYIEFVKQLMLDFKCKVCIRSSNRSGGFLNYNQKLIEYLIRLNTDRYNTILLIDLGFAHQHNINMLRAFTINTLEKITYLTNWSDIIIACGSFPEDLSNLPGNRIYQLDRLERNVWFTFHEIDEFKTVKYGDFGIKNPHATEINYPGNFSVKYTTINAFVIYTGDKTINNGNKNDQYINFANKLIQSADYYGNCFSWGDAEIIRIAKEVLSNSKRKPGNAATWKEISLNHHLTLIYHLLS